MKRSNTISSGLALGFCLSLAPTLDAVQNPPPKERPTPVDEGGSSSSPKPGAFPKHPTRFYASMVPLNLGKIKERCEDDSLSPEEARQRLLWLKNCHSGLLVATYNSINGDDGTTDAAKIDIIESEWFYVAGDRNKPKVRPNYLTFGTSAYENPLKWYAPKDSANLCKEFPEGYQVLGECTASCYEPDQKILFADGEIPIYEAIDKLKEEVLSLSDDSTLDNVNLQSRKVKNFTRSATSTRNQVVTITTQSGGQLKVTKNHPLLTGDGNMVEAGALKVGDHLVLIDGQQDLILTLDEKEYFGRVYNIQPDANSPIGQIIVAQGFLAGSSWYQNDGYEFINRLILRRNVPKELFP